MHVFVEKYNGSILILGEGQAMGWFLSGETNDLMMNLHDRSVIQALEVFSRPMLRAVPALETGTIGDLRWSKPPLARRSGSSAP
jgi:hypothetical protein